MSRDSSVTFRARTGRSVPARRKVIGYFVLSVIGVTMALPFAWMVLTSFKHRTEVESPHFLPKKWHPENYAVLLKLAKDPATIGKDKMVLDDGTEITGVDRVNFRDTSRPAAAGRVLKEDPREVTIHTGEGVQGFQRSEVASVDIGAGKYLPISFGRWYFNSFFVAAWVTVLQVLTSAMAAYAFSRIEWPGRDKVFLLYLGTMMIPGVVLMIPNFQIIVKFGLYNSYLGLIIPAAFSAFGTFLLRQFMLTIPKSLDEAAQIDGASHWRIFWDVIMPLARPGLIILAIFTFMGSYGSFFWPLVTIRDEHLYTLPVGMLYFDSTQGRATELIMAATVINILPMMILFIAMQKYLVKGIQLGAGAVKG
jgi:ABC-type glycerol-3-phosphate transport system permease component